MFVLQVCDFRSSCIQRNNHVFKGLCNSRDGVDGRYLPVAETPRTSRHGKRTESGEVCISHTPSVNRPQYTVHEICKLFQLVNLRKNTKSNQASLVG
jgi:hypothetical protein